MFPNSINRRITQTQQRLHAIIIPPARKSRVVAGLVAVSFFLSFICSYLPGISTLSDGTRTILLTVLISCAGAILFPVKTEEENADVQ